jgi:hypothetical protein
MSDDLADIRAELLRLSSSKRTRLVRHTKEAPCRWNPYATINPETSSPFTDASAWDFVAELLGSGHEIKRVPLRKPPGKFGYTMLVPGKSKSEDIYIKLQLGSGVVMGRSFHYSTQPDDDL